MTEWQTEKEPVSYDRAVSFMEERAAAIRGKGADDLVWFLEHPSLYTAGTSAKKEDLLNPAWPVYPSGRGGQYTYHGPGQRVAYVMMDLQKRGADLRRYIHDLEEWIILTLGMFDIQGERCAGRVGIWIGDDKIAAIGVRVRKWVTYHGISVNLDPDLSHYEGIIPCGLRGYGVTSFEKKGIRASMDDLDKALKQSWGRVFE